MDRAVAEGPFVQDEYNRQVLDMIEMAGEGKIVFAGCRDAEEGRWCVREMLRVYRGDDAARTYSGAAVDAALDAIGGRRPGRGPGAAARPGRL